MKDSASCRINLCIGRGAIGSNDLLRSAPFLIYFLYDDRYFFTWLVYYINNIVSAIYESNRKAIII